MLDLASLIGTVLGIGAVLAGQLLVGGSAGQIAQGTAAFVVLGGTLGAMLVSFPLEDVLRAFRAIPLIYRSSGFDARPLIEEIVRIATLARKEGLLAVEAQRQSIEDPLLKKSIKHLIDGLEPATVKEIIDTEIQISREQDESAARVFEGAGGYAPTIGIIGAVLGLIQVMGQLDNPSAIGPGIAVAFVAMIYGMGLSNLILLPWGTKLKRKADLRQVRKEVV